MAKFKISFGWGGGGGKLTPHHTNMTYHFQIWHLAVLLTLRLLSCSIDRLYPHWSMSKVEKTVESAIHARSTRDANFDKYKKHSLRGATGIEKFDGGSCIRLFSL